MVEKVQSTTKEENLDKEPNDELLELIADHYVGSYFQAVAGQILHRKINFALSRVKLFYINAYNKE